MRNVSQDALASIPFKLLSLPGKSRFRKMFGSRVRTDTLFQSMKSSKEIFNKYREAFFENDKGKFIKRKRNCLKNGIRNTTADDASLLTASGLLSNFDQPCRAPRGKKQSTACSKKNIVLGKSRKMIFFFCPRQFSNPRIFQIIWFHHVITYGNSDRLLNLVMHHAEHECVPGGKY